MGLNMDINEIYFCSLNLRAYFYILNTYG